MLCRVLQIPDVLPQVGTAITGFYYGLDLEIAPQNLLPTLVTIDRLQVFVTHRSGGRFEWRENMTRGVRETGRGEGGGGWRVYD